MLDDATVAVFVVPVSCVSQGGLEHTRLVPPMVAVATVAVLVVPVSCVSQGGLEQTKVTRASSTHLITHLHHCADSAAVPVSFSFTVVGINLQLIN